MRSALSLLSIPAAILAEVVGLLQIVLADQLDWRRVLAALGAHFFASVLLAEALAGRYAKAGTSVRSAWQLGFTLSFTLPVYGAVLTAVLVVRPPREMIVKEDGYLSPMEYRAQQAEAELAAEADKGYTGATVDAIKDAIKDEDKAKRLGAVEALRQRANKESVGQLALALKNTVFEVRFNAVEALAGINKKYSDRIGAAEAALDNDPCPENHRAMADVCYEYASMEMEEQSIQDHLWHLVIRHGQQAYAEGHAPDTALLGMVAEAFDHTGESEGARKLYAQMLTQNPGDYRALFGMATMQYREGKFDQLRQTCRRMLDLPEAKQDEEHIEVLVLWGGARG